MKKILILSAITFSLSSCYKDYSCSCITIDYSSIQPDTTVIEPTIWKGKKKTLEDRCERGNSKEGLKETTCTFSEY
jgi:hypothetical protein